MSPGVDEVTRGHPAQPVLSDHRHGRATNTGSSGWGGAPLVIDAFGLGPLTVPDQQHGNRVMVVDRSLAGAGHNSHEDAVARLGATDGLVTCEPGVPLTIMVADCAPVVLFDPVRRALGVAHAGRRGVVLDVIGATVGVMTREAGSSPEDLYAGVGPCIAATRYEIGGEALSETRRALGDDLLHPTQPGHAHFDVLSAVRRRLEVAGVKPQRTEVAGTDTYSAGDTFFSDRATRPCGRFMLVASLPTEPAERVGSAARP